MRKISIPHSNISTSLFSRILLKFLSMFQPIRPEKITKNGVDPRIRETQVKIRKLLL